MNLTWTRKREWDGVGMTHRADAEIGGDSYHFQVLSPRAGYWTMTAYKQDGAGMARYREATTMRDAKQLAEDFVAEVEAAARTEAKSVMDRATALVAAARARVQFRADTCGCRTPLHTMRCGFGGTVTVVSR